MAIETIDHGTRVTAKQVGIMKRIAEEHGMTLELEVFGRFGCLSHQLTRREAGRMIAQLENDAAIREHMAGGHA